MVVKSEKQVTTKKKVVFSIILGVLVLIIIEIVLILFPYLLKKLPSSSPAAIPSIELAQPDPVMPPSGKTQPGKKKVTNEDLQRYLKKILGDPNFAKLKNDTEILDMIRAKLEGSVQLEYLENSLLVGKVNRKDLLAAAKEKNRILDTKITLLIRKKTMTEADRDLMSYGDVYDKVWEGWRVNDVIAKMQKNPFLSFYPEPYYRGAGYYSNNWGFRHDENFPANKPEGEIRVFITGGSTAWGAGVAQEDLYSAFIQKKFKQKYPNQKIRIVASGVGGYTSTQERILIVNRISNLSPDVIVMFSGWNDAYAGYSGSDQLHEHFWSEKILDDNVIKQTKNEPSPSADTKNNLAILQLSQKIKNAWEIRMKNIEIDKAVRERMIEPMNTIGTVLKNIHIISDLCKRLNIPFIYYLQPSLYSTSKILTPREESSNKALGHKWVSEYNQVMYELYRKILPNDAMAENYQFIEGDEAIKSETKGLFIDHVHFGDRGNRLIAQHLFPIIDEALH